MGGRKAFSSGGFIPSEGIRLQKELRSRVVTDWDGRPVKIIAGADVHFPAKNTALAAIAVFSYPDLDPLEETWVKTGCHVPYIPGLLSFREIPPILQALRGLKTLPDLILCDGQGIAHPRGVGLASHLGLEIGIPTIGCAKSPLYGQFQEPGPEKGEISPITDKNGRNIGYVLRTRDNVRPLYVSPGHLINAEESVRIVLNCSPRFRIPVPLRQAHKLAGLYR